MNLLSWITIGFIVVGFIALISMKKSMEERVALAIENKGGIDDRQVSPKPVIWWIWGAVLWGMISIFLIVWSFSVYT